MNPHQEPQVNPPDPADPIARLMAAHKHTRAQLCVIAGGTGGAADLQPAIAWIGGPARQQRRILEQALIPALIESMAGSDAVCIRTLAVSLATQRATLERLWVGAIQPSLGRSVQRAAAPDAQALAAWATEFAAWLQRIDDELLPMAARLLDEEALAELSIACRVLPDTY